MGLHSPFGYVGYEVTFADILVNIIDKLCAHCHTNDDYRKGCRECPAGQLLSECKDYLLSYDESDKRFDLYASEEWAIRRKEPYNKEDPRRQKDAEMAQDYKPECEVLRAMKAKLKRINPHPFYFVKGGKKGHRRPKPFNDFIVLLEQYRLLRHSRLERWGLLVFE